MIPTKNKTTIHFTLIIIFSVICLYSIFCNWIFYLFIIIPVILIIQNKIKVRRLLIYIGIAIVPIFIYLLIHDYCVFENIPNKWITNNLTNFIDNSYSDNTSAIILLVCFGIKNNNESWVIYNETKHLSIVYLTSIGGLQISFLKLLISKVIRHKKTSNILNLIVIGFYSYVLSFRSGILRVLLCLIISMTCSKWIKDKYNRLSLAGLITVFIEPSCVFNYGFCLSYLCTFFVIWIYDCKINVFFEMIFINLGCILISIPFISKMEGVISFNSILFSIGFNYIFIILYLWYIFTFYLVFLSVVHDFLANNLILIINIIYAHNVEIKIGNLSNLFNTLFYIGLFNWFYWTKQARLN